MHTVSHMAGLLFEDTADLSDIKKNASLKADHVLAVANRLVAQVNEKAVADLTAKLDVMTEDLKAVAGGAADGAVWSISLTANSPWGDFVKTANITIFSGKFASEGLDQECGGGQSHTASAW